MRQTKRLLSVIAVMLVAACTDNSLTGPFSDAAGTYDLTVYAGKTPPATYTIQPNDPSYPDAPNGGTLVVRDGTIELQSNGTFFETNNYEITRSDNGSTVQRAFSRYGNWQVNGNQLLLDIPVQSGVSSSFRDFGTLTIDANGRYTINYDEDNGFGTVYSYEYKR